MRTRILRLLLLAPLIGLTANAEVLFLKLDAYFLPPNSRAMVRVLQETFQRTDGAVTLAQVSDISLHGPEFSGPAVEAIAWRTDAKTSTLEVQTGSSGTYVLIIGTAPRSKARKAADFNDYLRRNGISETLAQRTQNNELEKDVRELNSEYVRTIFQVGEKLTDHYKKRLNLPVEVIPQQNPYSLKVGQTLAFLCLVAGRPVGNQGVTAGWESPDGKIHTLSARTGADGIVHFKLAGDGKWYVKMNNTKRLSDPSLTYQSNWATVTFAVRNRRG